MFVQYVDHLGNDETVCNAARVSMDKTADLFNPHQNERLIGYLAKHNHWSPFSHCFVQMRFKAPIFVARQLAKHQVGFAWNEVSRRYVNSSPEFFMPEYFRNKADSVKQGSDTSENPKSSDFIEGLAKVHASAYILYRDMIDSGVCAEQARMVLPQSMMTEWIWSGSLYAWSRMYNLRIDVHSQQEVRSYAAEVDRICSKFFPISWRALKEVE